MAMTMIGLYTLDVIYICCNQPSVRYLNSGNFHLRSLIRYIDIIIIIIAPNGSYYE